MADHTFCRRLLAASCNQFNVRPHRLSQVKLTGGQYAIQMDAGDPRYTKACCAWAAKVKVLDALFDGCDLDPVDDESHLAAEDWRNDA